MKRVGETFDLQTQEKSWSPWLQPPASPGLLDALHPLAAVGLLLCAQLQRFLSIVAENDEEVVLNEGRSVRESEFNTHKKTASRSTGWKYVQNNNPIGFNHTPERQREERLWNGLVLLVKLSLESHLVQPCWVITDAFTRRNIMYGDTSALMGLSSQRVKPPPAEHQ